MTQQEETDWIRAVHEAHAGALFVFAHRALGDRSRAEEVVQDTLLRAWQHAHRFDPSRASLETWLFTIARNLIVDHRRRDGARPTHVLEADPVERADVADEMAIDVALEAWQVREALRRLTPDHREVIFEAYYRGSSVAEASRSLGIPQGTVKSRLHYALRALRLNLEEMGVVV